MYEGPTDHTKPRDWFPRVIYRHVAFLGLGVASLASVRTNEREESARGFAGAGIISGTSIWRDPQSRPFSESDSARRKLYERNRRAKRRGDTKRFGAAR